MLEIKVDINKSDLARLNKMSDEFRRGAEEGFRMAVLYLEGKAKQGFTKHLHVRTGTLRRGITAKASGLRGWLGDPVIYAGIHEFGGTIRAKRSKYLKFKIGNQWISKKEVKIPARPFLLPTIEENQNEVINIIASRIVEEIK